MSFFPSPVNAHQVGGLAIRKWPEDSQVNALFTGQNGCYRYWLYELWDNALPPLVYMLMNPSLAGIEFADPTAAHTGRTARSMRYGAQIIINPFAYRATNHMALYGVDDPIGPDNDLWIDAIARDGLLALGIAVPAFPPDIIVGHGSMTGKLAARCKEVSRRLIDQGRTLNVFRLSKQGQPWHPLYIPHGTMPIPWRP